MDSEVAESLAGVVRLLRRASTLVWQRVIVDGPGSPRQVLAVGIDIVADEAAALLLPAYAAEGPVPVGDDPARLLRSAHQLLSQLSTTAAAPDLDDLTQQVAELVWEANTGAEA
jgi:hypothetical protein